VQNQNVQTTSDMENIVLEPVAFVRSSRTDPSDDDWGEVRSTLELAPGVHPDSLVVDRADARLLEARLSSMVRQNGVRSSGQLSSTSARQLGPAGGS
jgi:hypothetical protein